MKHLLRMRSVIFLLLLASAQAAPVTIELNGGSVINGELLSWNGREAQVKAEFGTMTVKREQLSPKALERLELQSGDPQKLAARIAELEATVASLRRDNAALRQQLSQAPVAPAASTAAVSRPAAQAATSPTGLSYSRSSTGKRHNSNCRYFGSGSPCGSTDWVACKICGG